MDAETFKANAEPIRIILPDGTEVHAAPCVFTKGTLGWAVSRKAKPVLTIGDEEVNLTIGVICVKGSKPAEPPTEEERSLLQDGNLAGAVQAYRTRLSATKNQALKAFGL